jgi:hypothetical protein
MIIRKPPNNENHRTDCTVNSTRHWKRKQHAILRLVQTTGEEGLSKAKSNEYQMPQVLSKCEGGQIPLIALFKLTWLSTLKRDVGRDLLNYSAPASQTQLSYGILQRISQQWHPQSLFWHGRFEPPVVTESAEGLKTDGPVVLRSAPSPPFSQPSVLNFAEGRFQKVCSKYREILFLVKTLTWKFLAMTY